MDPLLEGLNEAQREAVTTTEGFVRVIAGAGSGKTRALSRRFAYLVQGVGILPGNILCVTFTNKSAAEMRQRIHRLTGDNDTGYINTFHGFCVTVLQEDIDAVSYPKSFLVLDNGDIDQMLGIIYEERGLTLRDMTFGKARDMIEMIKLKEKPDYYLDLINMSVEGLRQKYMDAESPHDIIFYGYLYQEKKCFGLDYNDLIIFTLHIFKENEAIRLKWQQRLEYIMIDEFQDIDDLQYRLMSVLCGYHKNLFIVGDPDQTIYTWRGANVKYLLNFDKVFPNVHTVIMTKNYRSTPQILSVVNSLISKNKNRIEKNLMPTLPDGPKVTYFHADTSRQEAAQMASHIKTLVSSGVPLRDITVLYRAHYVTRIVEEVFIREKIPYTIYSGIQFFDRKEIKDALSWLRMIAYQDDLSFLRVVNQPKRNIGRRRIAFLKEASEASGHSLYHTLQENIDNPIFRGTGAGDFIDLIEDFSTSYAGRSVSEVLTDILDKSGYEEMLRTEGSQERLDNLAELKQAVYEYEVSCGEETTLEEYLAHAATLKTGDYEESRDRVKLMTVHTAKGLEFPWVFLCGLNEGIFPSRKTRTRSAMEEERRLAFVAMTRAQKGLFLSESSGRNLDGSPRYPSRFILDIDSKYLDWEQKPDDDTVAGAREYIAISSRLLDEDAERTLYPVGQRVVHRIMGPGTIVEIDEDRKAYVIQFDEIDTPRRISLRLPLKAENEQEQH